MVDDETIATGDGSRTPDPTREEYLERIPTLEARLRRFGSRQTWLPAALSAAQVKLSPTYGTGTGTIFGQAEQPLEDWTTQQLKNWYRYLLKEKNHA